MSKNLTRKGIAFGAAVALGSTLLAGAPAFAAVGIDLDSNGTTGVFGQVEATPFTFTGNGNSEFPVGNATQLRVHVKNLNGGTASGFAINGTTLDADFVSGSGNAIRHANGTTFTVATLGTTIGDTAVMGLGATDDDGDADSISVMTSPFTFAFTSDAADDVTRAYEVTVFADTNNNGVKDTNETASAARTVTFYDVVDLTATVTLDAVTEGDTTVAGSAVISNIDMKQIAAQRVGIWLRTGTNGTLAPTAGNLLLPGATSTNATAGVTEYDATNKRFNFKTDAQDNGADSLDEPLVKDTAVKGTFVLDTFGATSPAVGDAITTTGSATVGARTTGSIVVDTVDSSTTARATAAATVTADVALNSAYAVKAIVKDTATVAKVLAGKAVTAVVTVPTGTLSSTVTASINGTVYTDETKLPGATGIAKLALTTDANGEVTVNIITAGFTAGDDVTVAFTVENRTATITTNNATLAYTGYITNALDGVATTDGVAAKVDVIVRDQFGGRPANGKYTVSSDWVSSTQSPASTAASESFIAVVDGAASLSILDNGTGVGANVYDIELNTLGSNGAVSASADITANFAVDIKTAADLAVGTVDVVDTADSAITQDSTTKVYKDTLVTGDGNSAELLLQDVFANDSRTATVSAPTVAGADGADIQGYVKTAASATAAAVGIPGAEVTISGAGILFGTTVQNSAVVYAVGSITVRTDKNGKYDVQAWSNKSGVQTVTITASGKTATLSLDKFDAAAADTGTVLKIDAPAYILPGRTLTVKATLVDKYGNPVAVPNTNATSPTTTLAYSGPGFTTSAITQTLDADGQSTFRVLLGSADDGSATVTFTYDADGTTATIAKLTSTAIIQIGATPVAGATAAIAGSTKRFFVSVDGNSSARNAVVKVAGRTFATLKGSSAKKTYVVRAPKGSHKVTVFVGGKLIATKTISVK
jgi:trimeric autotransporter adhesin